MRAVLQVMVVLASYNANDPEADHTEHAIELDDSGDAEAALVAFRCASCGLRHAFTRILQSSDALHT